MAERWVYEMGISCLTPLTDKLVKSKRRNKMSVIRRHCDNLKHLAHNLYERFQFISLTYKLLIGCRTCFCTISSVRVTLWSAPSLSYHDRAAQSVKAVPARPYTSFHRDGVCDFPMMTQGQLHWCLTMKCSLKGSMSVEGVDSVTEYFLGRQKVPDLILDTYR